VRSVGTLNEYINSHSRFITSADTKYIFPEIIPS